MRLGREPDGHPFVTTVTCEAHVADLDMQFHGGARYVTKRGRIVTTARKRK